jgi:threonine/homoserine/homoserine lactone efflux protein
MDPILSYPIKYGRRQMRGWILVLIFMALFFLGIYGTSLLMAKPIAGERRRDESEMDHFNKVQDSYVGAVFIVIGIALVMGFVIARLSRPE